MADLEAAVRSAADLCTTEEVMLKTWRHLRKEEDTELAKSITRRAVEEARGGDNDTEHLIVPDAEEGKRDEGLALGV